MRRLPPVEETVTSSPSESLDWCCCISGRAKASAAPMTADALCRDPGSSRGPSVRLNGGAHVLVRLREVVVEQQQQDVGSARQTGEAAAAAGCGSRAREEKQQGGVVWWHHIRRARGGPWAPSPARPLRRRRSAQSHCATTSSSPPQVAAEGGGGSLWGPFGERRLQQQRRVAATCAESQERQWCSGNIQASHACAPGSTPGWRIFDSGEQRGVCFCSKQNCCKSGVGLVGFWVSGAQVQASHAKPCSLNRNLSALSSSKRHAAGCQQRRLNIKPHTLHDKAKPPNPHFQTQLSALSSLSLVDISYANLSCIS